MSSVILVFAPLLSFKPEQANTVAFSIGHLFPNVELYLPVKDLERGIHSCNAVYAGLHHCLHTVQNLDLILGACSLFLTFLMGYLGHIFNPLDIYTPVKAHWPTNQIFQFSKILVKFKDILAFLVIAPNQ